MRSLLLLLLFPFILCAQSPFLVEEEFDNAPTAPTGWTFTSIAAYTSGTMSGKSVNALKFDATNDQVVTKNWGGGGDQMSFVLRASGTPNTSDNLLIEVFNGTSWSTLANAKPRSTARVFVFTISTSITQARFTYTKSAVNVELDDFTIRQSGKCSGTAPYITAINVDACGSGCEGMDEFFTFLTGSTAMNLSDIEVSYPDANNSSVTWCGSATNPCDNYITTNSSEVTALNTLAGCTVFLSPSGSIPAYASVMVFNGNPQNTRANFSSLCSGGSPQVQYYALFANNTSDCNGRFGNYTATSSCTPECYRGFFIRDRGTGCTDTNYYSKDGIGNADGAAATYTSPGASPSYVLTSCNSFLVLPVTFLNTLAIRNGNRIIIEWQTASEANLHHFTVQRSEDGINFSDAGRVPATNSTVMHQYKFTDEEGEQAMYYRIAAVDIDGTEHYSDIIIAPFSTPSEFVTLINSNGDINILLNGETTALNTVNIRNSLGQEIHTDTFIGNFYTYSSSAITSGSFLVISIISADRTINKRIIYTR